ncbi:hypothetical protein KRR39_03645 [Nocardioides panacis]|uniref:DUF4333 domain-containing protein n=1 Tax=Nocardioides panacis TaxID=2849501 RepID=A0A975Y0Y2_9ACTN|nr:hypothetical protein [Nocardioides panacis]QWZ08946.1 hypothetical protein KRR39_03645 [Nocardioides panacis]
MLRRTPLLVLAASAALLTGCHDQPAPRPAAAPSGQVTPALGGRLAAAHRPPDRPMNRLERPVHARLAAQVAGQGLTLTYLDCPPWDGTVPSRMTCTAYVDGVLARVAVHLKAAVEGKAVSFDAKLLDGVIATRNLEATLRRQGWQRADCGDAPAYPATVGSRIVCRVTGSAGGRYVQATVTERSGAVMIADYRARS